MVGQADVLMWEFAMARNPYIKQFVELGTVSGAGSLYFGMAARLRGGTLHTFDKYGGGCVCGAQVCVCAYLSGRGWRH